jgi:DNA-binding GntR family transcriptional regulator
MIFDQKSTITAVDIEEHPDVEVSMADLSSMTPLRRENLQAIVYRQICDLILQGGIEPGQSVTIASLAKALDVSPMPVREAISRLTHVGALTAVSGRSMGVPRLSPADFAELKNVRVEIEGLAMEWAVARRTEAFEAQLRKLLVDLIDAERKRDNKRFIRLNYQFHNTIYSNAGSGTLQGIIQNLWLRISPYFHLLDVHGHLHLSNELHHRMIDSIAAGDAEAARTALVDDIERAYSALVKLCP